MIAEDIDFIKQTRLLAIYTLLAVIVMCIEEKVDNNKHTHTHKQKHRVNS